ncbi:MAG TPA: segregation/condensation protein A [Gemmatimonadaceae bacterium]|nr:segregation/condensation protein A [Gemmatimonadaceae bacterium]
MGGAVNGARAGASPFARGDVGGESFVVDLGSFSGPLDLLLALIREDEIDIYDIPIARIAEQFLVRIRTLGLNDAADYLEMAARLLRIKAQMLLPRHGDSEQWEDPRAELVRRLLEYQQMREVVDVLEHRADERRRRFARSYLPQAPAPPAAPLALSLSELLAAVDRILRVAREPTLHDVIPRALDVDGAMATVRSALALRASLAWSDMVRGPAEPWQILSMLLALLELARRGELRLTQSRPFGSVEILRDAAGQAA